MQYTENASRTNTLLVIAFLFLSLLLSAYTKENPNVAKFGQRFLLTLLSPAQQLLAATKEVVSKSIDSYLYLVDVESENQDLRSRIKHIQTENLQLLEAQHENFQLKRILEYKTKNNLAGTVANVIAASSGLRKSITINQGKTAGIEIGQVVVDGVAVVGQVINVVANSSEVLLLTDSASSMDGLIQDTRVRGLASGASSAYLNWDYVSIDSEIKLGEKLITSGLDGIYPRGLLIGVVTKIGSKDSYGLFRKIEIQPAAKFDDLEIVMVLK